MIDGKPPYSMNKQVGRMKAKSAIAAPDIADGPDDNEQPDSEPAHSHAIHHVGGGKFHSVTHHADGHVSHADHASYDDAAAKGKSSEQSASDEPDGDEHGIPPVAV